MFLPILISRMKEIPKVSARTWGYMLFSGFAGSAVGTVFFTLSLKYGNPTVVNVILNIQPVISTLGAFFLFGDRLTRASSFTQASPFWRESFCQSSIPRSSENLSRKRD